MTKKVSALIGHDGKTRRVEYEVPDNEPGLWGADYDFSIIGKDVPRLDAVAKVTGKAKFSHDIKRPNMLYAVMVTCPYPHARIENVDISDAEKMPGVRSVDIFEDSSQVARCEGWYIAAVAADTIQQARDAARKVKVTYKELPFVIDPDEAMLEEAPSVHKGGNVAKSRPRSRGDIEKGFQEADVISEGTYTVQVQTHSTFETHGCVAEWNGDELTVWHSTQYIVGIAGNMARAFKIPETNVRCICQHMGGGFGSKFGPETFGIKCAQIAKKTGRPVKLMADRYVDSLMCGNKPGAKMQVKVGAKKDGTLTAIDAKVFNVAGHSGSSSVSIPFFDHYECPNVHVEEYNVRINAGNARAYRAPGRPQGAVGIEMALEELAMKLEMDPLELRMKNVPWSELDAREYEYKTGAERFGWKERIKKRGANNGRIKRGVGCAGAFWHQTGSSGGATVRCSIFPDGSVEVANVVQDLGTGIRTVMAVIASEELGIGLDAIKVSIGDSKLGLNGPASGGSTTTPTVTPALRNACYQAKRELFQKVASKWKTNVDDIDCKNGIVICKSNSDRKMPWKKAAAMIRSGTIEAVSKAEKVKNDAIPGINIGTASRGAQFAEVEVDTETGKVRCTKFVAVQDCGKAIAKKQAESQVCGAVIMGLSFALSEDRIMDNMTGRQINPNMESYKFIHSQDIPDIETVLVDVYDPIINTSAKGLGEPPYVPPAAAIGCAVANALGVPIREMPITPDKVLAALKGKEG